MDRPLASPYQLGARRGLPFGAILCAMFFAIVRSQVVPLLSLLAVVLFIAVPFVIYLWLRRTYVSERGMTTLSGLWMQGIMIFACGSMLCAAVSAAYLKWIEPEYISSIIHQAIDFYQGVGDDRADRVADMLERMVKAGAVPSGAYMAFEMMWLSIFSGSLLSLLLSLLAMARGVSPVPPAPPSIQV